MKTFTWIVVAGASIARFYSQEHRKAKFELVEELTHPEGRLHAADLDTDALGERSPGRHNVGGVARAESGYQPSRTPRQHENDLFSREVADRLRKAQIDGRFQELVIAAGPEFLALLRKALDPIVAAAVRVELN